METEKKQQERHYAFYTNRECEFFPCHKGIDEMQFNCLFCYCPLYALGEDCPGVHTYTKTGIKDCSGCTFPHKKENYDTVLKYFPKIAKLAEKKQS